MPAPPVLLDEDVRPAVGAALAARGYDVLSVLEVGPRSVEDSAVLERAVTLGRVLITHNTHDFKAIHAAYEAEGRSHSGIVCIPQSGPVSRRTLRAAMLLDWIATQSHASGIFVWGHLQRQIEQGLRISGYTEEEALDVLGRSRNPPASTSANDGNDPRTDAG